LTACSALQTGKSTAESALIEGGGRRRRRRRRRRAWITKIFLHSCD
jgi:hypothetical protein